MLTALILTLLLVVATPARADVGNLETFLRAVEEANTLTVPLRGDGVFEVVSPEATRRISATPIVRPPADLFIELQGGIKALLPASGDHASLLKPGASKAEDLPPAGSLQGSDFTREDLEPFRLSHYKEWRISDESEGEVTVLLFPTASQYSIVVATFDIEKKVPLKTLYYRDTLNNLVKMRRDSGYILIGRKPMATTITMETFKLRTHSSFTLRWTQNPSFPPELFDPMFLSHPSGIAWSNTPTP